MSYVRIIHLDTETIMVVDAHLHVWRSVPNYPEPTSTTVSPLCDIPVELFAEYMNEHGVDRGVLVQPLYPGEDNSYVADCAARDPNRFKAVCVVDPRKPQANERLEYWVQEHGCKGLRLRPKLSGEATAFGHSSSYPLWEAARRLGVVINVLTGPEHLITVSSLAMRFPEVPILIDHMGHPNIVAGIQPPPFRSLLRLAKFPNVYVKVSGYYYYSHQPYPHSDCEDLFKAVYDQFGPARLIWGSDFPHVLLKSSYRRTLLWLDRSFQFLNPKELSMILGENASRLYWE